MSYYIILLNMLYWLLLNVCIMSVPTMHSCVKQSFICQTTHEALSALCWHEVTLLAKSLQLQLFPLDDVCGSASGCQGSWVSTTEGSACVWSSHFYVSNQLSPPGGSTLNKAPAICSPMQCKQRPRGSLCSWVTSPSTTLLHGATKLQASCRSTVRLHD